MDKKYYEDENGFIEPLDREECDNDVTKEEFSCYLCDDYPILGQARKEWLFDKNFAMEAVRVWADNFKYLPRTLRMDKDVIAIAADSMNYYRDFCFYKFIPQELFDDPDMFLSVMKYRLFNKDSGWEDSAYNNEIQWASDRLKQDKKFAKEYLSLVGESIRDFDDSIKSDFELVKTAIISPKEEGVLGATLQDIYPFIVSDCETIIHAMGNAYETYIWQSNKSIIKKCINLIPQDLKVRSDFWRDLVSVVPMCAKYAPKNFQNSEEIMIAVCKNGVSTFCDIYKLEDVDIDLLVKIVKGNPYILQYASPDLLKNKELLLKLIKAGVDVKGNFPIIYRVDRDFMYEIIQQDLSYVKLLSPKAKEDDRFIAFVNAYYGNNKD